MAISCYNSASSWITHPWLCYLVKSNCCLHMLPWFYHMLCSPLSAYPSYGSSNHYNLIWACKPYHYSITHYSLTPASIQHSSLYLATVQPLPVVKSLPTLTTYGSANYYCLNSAWPSQPLLSYLQQSDHFLKTPAMTLTHYSLTSACTYYSWLYYLPQSNLCCIPKQVICISKHILSLL